MEILNSSRAKLSEYLSNISIRTRGFQFLLLVSVCIAFGLIDSLRSYAETHFGVYFHESFLLILRWDLSGWLVWVVFIPFIFWLCNRFPINHNTWKKSLLLFAPIGLLFSLGRTLFPILVYSAIEGFADLRSWLPDRSFMLLTDYIVALSFFMLVLTFGQAKNYYTRFQDQEIRASQLEAQLSKAELRALKMQLHPHFLFNVLNSIAALQLENPRAAQEMTVRLGDFLRMTLDNVGAQKVTLEKEIAMIECYLDIEKIRFGDRLSSSISVSADALDCRIPNLLLQPIVENAIKHGINQKTEGGRIEITAEKDSGWLEVKIRDNGNGMKDEKKDVLSSGIGLSNTRARLEQSYGEEFRFDLENRKDQGLLVTLLLPATESI